MSQLVYVSTDFLWTRKWQPTPVFLPGEFHGQRSLASYNPWGHKESYTARLPTHIHTVKLDEAQLYEYASGCKSDGLDFLLLFGFRSTLYTFLLEPRLQEQDIFSGQVGGCQETELKYVKTT